MSIVAALEGFDSSKCLRSKFVCGSCFATPRSVFEWHLLILPRQSSINLAHRLAEAAHLSWDSRLADTKCYG